METSSATHGESVPRGSQASSGSGMPRQPVGISYQFLRCYCKLHKFSRGLRFLTRPLQIRPVAASFLLPSLRMGSVVPVLNEGRTMILASCLSFLYEHCSKTLCFTDLLSFTVGANMDVRILVVRATAFGTFVLCFSLPVSLFR